MRPWWRFRSSDTFKQNQQIISSTAGRPLCIWPQHIGSNVERYRPYIGMLLNTEKSIKKTTLHFRDKIT